MLAAGQPVLLNQSAPPQRRIMQKTRGRRMRKDDMPDAFMAVSSLRSARLPSAMMEATNTARGRAKLTRRAEAKTMSLNTTHNSKPLPIMSSA